MTIAMSSNKRIVYKCGQYNNKITFSYIWTACSFVYVFACVGIWRHLSTVGLFSVIVGVSAVMYYLQKDLTVMNNSRLVMLQIGEEVTWDQKVQVYVERYLRSYNERKCTMRMKPFCVVKDILRK